MEDPNKYVDMDNIKFEDFISKMQRLIDEARKQNAFHEFIESNDKNKPKGGIVKEDFNEGNGSYKVNLAYLNEEQVKEIEGLVKKWNPELKESEDERMWKLIKKYAHYNISDLALEADHITREQLETWLEKQGEQDPYNGVSFKYNGHTWGMCARDNGVDILLDRQLIKHLEKQGEKKHSWGERENAYLDFTQSAIEFCYAKNNPLRKQLVTWLKSLKDRCIWQPSDEQMKALEHFVRSVGESGYASPYENNTKLLYSLLEDLKKLE